MRLLELEVMDFKRFTGRPRVVRFDGRATVLSGPNEAGKSTLFEAVRHALFDRSGTQSGWVKRLVPYGSNAIPAVRLDFEHEGRALRIEKRFGGKGDAVFSERRGDGWVTLARNDDGEEKLLSLLGATSSRARDGSPPSNWGAFQWLLVPQDLRGLPEPEAARCLGLDAAGVTGEFDAVQRLAQREFDRFFTPTGRSIATQSDLFAIVRRIEELEQRSRELQEKVRDLDEMRGRHDGKVEELPLLEQEVNLARVEWEEAQREAEGLSSARGEHQVAIEALRGARDRAEAASSCLKERSRLEKAAREAEEAHRGAVTRAAQDKALFEQASLRLSVARETAARAGDEAAEVRRRLLDAERCLAARNERKTVEHLRDLHGRAIECDTRIAKAMTRVGGEPPRPEEVERAQGVEEEARTKRASAHVAALKVLIEGEPGVSVRADGRDVTGREAVALESVVVETGGGRVTVSGDTAAAQKLAEEARDLDLEVAKLLAGFGVKTVNEIRALRDERLAAKADLESLKRERKAIDKRSADALAAEIAGREAQAAEAERARVEAGADAALDAMPDDLLRAEWRVLSDRAQKADKALGDAREERERLDKEYETQRSAIEESLQGEVRAETSSREAVSALDRHRDRHGSTDACLKANEKAREDLQTAEAREKDTRKVLDRLTTSADMRRETARQKYMRLDESMRTVDADIRLLSQTLEDESSRGFYTRLGETERGLTSEQARRTRLGGAAEAARLLRQVMEEVRGRIAQLVVAPIKEDLDGLLATVTNGRYLTADIRPDMQPERLAGGSGGECAFEGGSQGLRELVATLIRVAVARHLSRTGPQVVVLDDPCVHVSRERTARLVEVLNSLTAGASVQAVVLTHRQAEFAGLIGSTVDVAAL